MGLATLTYAQTAVERHFAAAERAQKTGELDTAVREYQEILQLEPQLAEVHANLGLVYFAQSRFDDSAKELDRALQLKPTLRAASFWLAVDQIKLGKPELAIPRLRGAVARNPQDREAQRWLGTALWNAGHVFAALDQLAKASRTFPEDAESRFVLAEAYRKTGDREIEAILAAVPGTALYHQIYGDIYRDHRSWDRAEAHYGEALKIDSHWKGAHLGLAEVDIGEGKLHEAKAELQQELEIDPNSTDARTKLTALTNSTEGAGQPEIAVDAAPDETKLAAMETELRGQLDRRPNDLRARYALARVLKGESLATTNALIQQSPDSPRVYELLGQAFEDRQEQRRALEEYRIVEQKEPSLPGIHYKIGHLLWQLGDHANALEELQQELKLDPQSAEANGEIGSILLVDGEAAKAIPYLKAALASDPGVSLIHRQLGKAYMMQENYPKAEVELQQAIKTDTDGSTFYQLAMVYRAQGRRAEAAKAMAESEKIRAARMDASTDAAQSGMTR